MQKSPLPGRFFFYIYIKKSNIRLPELERALEIRPMENCETARIYPRWGWRKGSSSSRNAELDLHSPCCQEEGSDWAAKDAVPDAPEDNGALVCRDGASSGSCGSCRSAQQQIFLCQGPCLSLHSSDFEAGEGDGGVEAPQCCPETAQLTWGFQNRLWG